MDLPEDLWLPPEVPRFHMYWGKSYAEQWLTFGLNVAWLRHYVANFAGAVQLAEHSREIADESRLGARWVHMAGRDGALNLYHYSKSIKAVRQLCSAVPTVREYIDMVALRRLVRSFNKRFPHAEYVRHLTAHAADFVSTPDLARMHSRETENGERRWFLGRLDDDNVFRVVYRPTHRKEAEEFSYDLTRDALGFLLNNLRECYAVLGAAEPSTSAEKVPSNDL